MTCEEETGKAWRGVQECVLNLWLPDDIWPFHFHEKWSSWYTTCDAEVPLKYVQQ